MAPPQLKSPTTLIHDIFESSSSDTDLIVRTSDNVRLYVSKFFLTYHSQFFANLFADSSPDETEEVYPVFRAEEDGRDVRAILHLCYPMNVAATPYILEAAFRGSLISALKKYMMERALACLRDMVAASEWPRKEPLMTFVMARRCDWQDIGRAAAWESLRFPLRAQTSVPELSMISGLDYHCLIQYFWRCTDAARNFLKGSGRRFSQKPEIGCTAKDSIIECELSLAVERRFPKALVDDKSFFQLFVIPQASGPCRIQCKGCSEFSDAVLANRTNKPCFMHPWLRHLIQRARAKVEQYPRVSLSHESILQDTALTARRACPLQTPEMIQTIVKLLDDELESVLLCVKLEVEGW